MQKKIKVAVIGPGNIGTDLMYKIMRSNYLDIKHMAGIVESEGIRRAKSLGVFTTINNLEPLLKDEDVKIVFEATTASAHIQNAPLLKKAEKIAIDLTPAAIGPYVVPVVNLDKVYNESNLNLITCGGQATIPIVYAISRVTKVLYAEIVSSIASKSAGPGTRQNIDEFTQTTAKGLEVVGGAKKGKAIIILNPAEPPVMMKDTIYTKVENPDEKLIKESIYEMVRKIQHYVPGYKLLVPPLIEGDKVTTIIEVEGAGDFLPKYAGNLDIMTSAAVAIAEGIVKYKYTNEKEFISWN
jgi:acetaldehyde dehydrogenase